MVKNVAFWRIQVYDKGDWQWYRVCTTDSFEGTTPQTTVRFFLQQMRKHKKFRFFGEAFSKRAQVMRHSL